MAWRDVGLVGDQRRVRAPGLQQLRVDELLPEARPGQPSTLNFWKHPNGTLK